MGSFLLFQDYIALLPRYHGAPDWLLRSICLPMGFSMTSEPSEPTAILLLRKPNNEMRQTRRHTLSLRAFRQACFSKEQNRLLPQTAIQTTKKHTSFNSESVPAKATRKEARDLP